MQILNIRPGPQMKEITNFVKELTDENPNVTKEEAIQLLKNKFQNVNPPEIKQASKEDKKKMSDLCPEQILQARISEINNALNEKKYYEAFTILNDLKNEYGNDEKIVRLLAVGVFKLLVVDNKLKYNDLTQHIFDKAEVNFFDAILCSYVVGILLLLDTETEDDAIKKIAQRVIKMSPTIIGKVLKSLPKIVAKQGLRQELELMLNLS